MTDRWMRLLLVPMLLAVAVAAAHLMPGLDGSTVEGGIRNSLHVIGFAGVAAILYEVIPLGRGGKAIGAFVIVLLTGALSESVQQATGRSADIVDLYRDAAGASSFLVARLVWVASSVAKRRPAARRMSRVLAVMIGSLALAPLAYWSIALVTMRSRAPIILDFDSRWSPYYFHGINADVTLVYGVTGTGTGKNHALAEATLSRRFRSGIAVATALHDWSPYATLVFDAQIAGAQATALTVHINDYAHIGHFADTTAGRVRVTGTSTEFRIPIREVTGASGRGPESLSDIRQVVFLARDRRDGAKLRVDNIRLE